MIQHLYSLTLTNCTNGHTNGKCCILSIHRKHTPPTLNYTLGSTLVDVVNFHSYPGVTVSSDLHWHEHVNNVSAKATKTLNFICHNVYCCPPDTKATSGLSTSRICSSCLGSLPCCDCKQLEKVQCGAVRFVK